VENIKGTYRFFLDGELVYEQDNALTTMGRSIAIKSLLGIIPNFANSIAYGVGDKPNTVDPSTNLITDNSLQFEIGRTSVFGSSLQINNSNDVLVYSGVIDDAGDFSIYEVALFPNISSNTFIGLRASTIFSFDQVNTFTQVGTASGAFMASNSAARIGTDMMYVPQTSSANYLQYNTSGGEFDYLDGFTAEDVFRLAAYNPSASSASVVFRMYNNSDNYYELVFSAPSASGYFISEVPKYNASLYGNPTWTNISFVRFWEEGSSDGILLDGMKINTGSYLIDTNTGMISRAVLSTPLRKPASIPLTIEYSLNVGFNEGF
jgi:hypothetical protein